MSDRDATLRRHAAEQRRFQARFGDALDSVAASASDLEHRAVLLLAAGCEHEKARAYEKAASTYREGLACEPGDPFTAYFLHNNYGFCLNVLGQHAEAEWYCRTAIALDPSRPNGHKNLGISLEARGEYESAIESWITATMTYPEDGRSLAHLEQLLETLPHLEGGIPGLAERAEDCRREVLSARARRRKGRPSR